MDFILIKPKLLTTQSQKSNASL